MTTRASSSCLCSGVGPPLVSPSATRSHCAAARSQWHLGMFTDEYTPTQRGFDEFVGYYQGEEDAYTHRNVYPEWDGYSLGLQNFGAENGF